MNVTITLDENPSTGYRWETNIRPSADELVMPVPTNPPRIGQGGQRTLTFNQLESGDNLVLDYRRSFDPPEVQPVKRVQVVVS